MDILFIEDEENALVGLRVVLKEDGHKVDVAMTGDEAVELMKKKNYDVVLLDIMLPAGKSLTGVPFRETGKVILLRLRSGNLGKLKTDKDVPVVVITAVSDLEVITALDDAGNICVLKKPIDPMDAYSKIKEFISGDQSVQPS